MIRASTGFSGAKWYLGRLARHHHSGRWRRTGGGETVGQVFRRVTASVTIVRTGERDISQQSGAATATVAGLGSGVVIDARGYVRTAAHVVQTVDEVTVEFMDGHVSAACLVWFELEADLTLLELESVSPGAPRHGNTLARKATRTRSPRPATARLRLRRLTA